MKTAITLNQNARSLFNLNCEVHTDLVEDGRCSCSVAASVPKLGSTVARPKQRYTIMSDPDCNYFYIPTDEEQAFEAWVAAGVNGEEEAYYYANGKDFSDYTIGGALTRLSFENPLAN